MGDLVNLQAYREKKEAEEARELQELFDKVRDLIAECGEPESQYYYVDEKSYFDLSAQHCSFTDELIEYYYRHDSIFFAESLLAFINEGEIDEEFYAEQRTECEIEPDGT